MTCCHIYFFVRFDLVYLSETVDLVSSYLYIYLMNKMQLLWKVDTIA